MNDTALGKVFQEISDEFANMAPTSLDELEDKVLTAMYKLGSCLMDTKLTEWNNKVQTEKEETCSECGTKLKHKQKSRQIATWVCDVHYKRYRNYCPECKRAEYPLDQVLKIKPMQRMSSSVAELSALCGAS